MRGPLLVSLVSTFVLACAPKVTTTPSHLDEEIAPKRQAAPETDPDETRLEAPVGKGLRSGTIARDRLVAVLDQGPGTFLRQLEVTARMQGERFVGWQLVQLNDQASPLRDVDVVPGDVLVAINGKPLSRPDQLQTVWDSLRTADRVTAHLWRGAAKVTLEFAIEPPVASPGKSSAVPAQLPKAGNS